MVVNGRPLVRARVRALWRHFRLLRVPLGKETLRDVVLHEVVAPVIPNAVVGRPEDRLAALVLAMKVLELLDGASLRVNSIQFKTGVNLFLHLSQSTFENDHVNQSRMY